MSDGQKKEEEREKQKKSKRGRGKQNTTAPQHHSTTATPQPQGGPEDRIKSSYSLYSSQLKRTESFSTIFPAPASFYFLVLS